MPSRHNGQVNELHARWRPALHNAVLVFATYHGALGTCGHSWRLAWASLVRPCLASGTAIIRAPVSSLWAGSHRLLRFLYESGTDYCCFDGIRCSGGHVELHLFGFVLFVDFYPGCLYIPVILLCRLRGKGARFDSVYDVDSGERNLAEGGCIAVWPLWVHTNQHVCCVP